MLPVRVGPSLLRLKLLHLSSTLQALHLEAPALLRLPNPSLGILKSVTSLDIDKFMTFISGCASGEKSTSISFFLKLRRLTSVIHLTFWKLHSINFL